MLFKNHIVLPEYNLVFFCIPKVANSSIKAAFLMALGHKVIRRVKHQHPALNLKTQEVIVEQFNHYTKFAVVRNTWDRIVSCYAQKICTDRVYGQGFSSLGFTKNMPFDDFIEIVCKNTDANHHFASQLEMISYKKCILPGFVYRLERIGEAWPIIKRRISALGLQIGDLPELNKSIRRPYREYYSDRSKKMIADAYAPEIEAFGYSF